MKEYIVKYLQEKNVNFKESGNEQFVLELCPMCGDNKFHHFYMNQNEGLWDCKKCNATGNFNQFRKFFGDSEIDLSAFEKEHVPGEIKKKEYKILKYDIPLQYMSRLWNVDKPFQEYLLEKRKLDKTLLEKFKIGSTGKEISIPIFEDNKLVNIRYRRDPALDATDTGAKYSQEKGCKAALFNGDILKEPLKQIYVTEGEFDALQLIQRGFRNTVSVTLGAGYFPQDWVEKFKEVQQIYLVFDTDEEGISGAKKAAEKLGVDRCKLVQIPKNHSRKKTDVTNYFVDDGFTKADFVELVNKAKSIRSVEANSIKHISEFNDPLRKLLLEGEHLGFETGFPILDSLVGGFRKGRLVIISGLTNTGKSSFAINVALKMAVNKLPIFYLSLEMPPIDIVKKILMLRAKLGNDQLKNVTDPSAVLTQVDQTLLEFKGQKEGEGLPIYLYNGSGVVKYKILADCARIVKEEYGAQCIFVDHLHYFATNYNNLSAETSKVVRDIKQLAIELDIPIVLLAHLNRGGRTKQRTGMYIPALSDLRDTGAIEQDADQVIFVCRDSENEDKAERQKTVIKVAKNRDGYAGRSVSMEFDENITTFAEAGVNIDYEKDAKQNAEEQSKTLPDEPPLTLSVPF